MISCNRCCISMICNQSSCQSYQLDIEYMFVEIRKQLRFHLCAVFLSFFKKKKLTTQNTPLETVSLSRDVSFPHSFNDSFYVCQIYIHAFH